MRALPLTVWPSQANFILFRPNQVAGRVAWQSMLDAGVLVRDCSSWDGLTDCLRVTVGTAAENDAFLTVLRGAVMARD
jgi:histidinol-phosphate aminotransferase